MKIFYRISFCFLLAIVCSGGSLYAQQAAGDKGNGKQAVAEQNKTPQSAESKSATHAGESAATGKEAAKETAPRHWGIQITTGEKWYQLNVKLVM